MTYSRKYSRRTKYDVMKERKKGSRAIQIGVLSALATFSSFLGGIAYAEGPVNVTRPNGVTVNGDTNANGVANLYAEQVNRDNKIGINRFNSFDVKANETVNLHFQNSDGDKTIKVDKLVNLVNGGMNVAGTVNAIKDNKIGGDLYFLSSGGIAVTKSGVINAGSLTMVTARSTLALNFLADKFAANNGSENSGRKEGSTIIDGIPFVDQGGDMNAFMEKIANSGEKIPLNPSGTITVEGKIRTSGGVTLRAGRKVTIGSADSVKPTSVEDKDINILTGVTNFTNYVNTEKLPSGTGLTAVADGGDVVLIAKNAERNSYDSTSGLHPIDVMNSNNEVKTEVFQYGNIKSNKGVTILADSTVSQERAANAISNVQIFGKIEAKDDVKLDAKSTLEMIDEGKGEKKIVEDNEGNISAIFEDFVAQKVTDLKDNAINAFGLIGLDLTPDYSLSGSKATLAINENAIVKTDGNIEANAKIDSVVAVGDNTAAQKKFNIKALQWIPSVSLNYLSNENNAKVIIDGSLTGKSVSAKSEAKATVLSSAENTGKVKDGTQDQTLRLALSMLLGENKASTTVGSTGSITTTGTWTEQNPAGDVTLDATATTALENNVTNQAAGNAGAALSINITNYDSDATTKVEGSINSAHDVNVTATNNLEGLDVTTLNGMGKGKWAQKETDFVNSIKESDAVKSLKSKLPGAGGGSDGPSMLDTMLGKMFGEDSSTSANIKQFVEKIKAKMAPTPDNPLQEFGKKFSIGGAVQYIDVTNHSKVDIGSKLIKAGNDVNFKAKTNIDDIGVNLASQVNNYSQNNTNKYSGAVTVLVSNVDNSSDVIVRGKTIRPQDSAVTNKESGVYAKGNVNITAETINEYNRLADMKDQLEKAINELEALYSNPQNFLNFATDDVQKLINDTKTLISTARGQLNNINRRVDEPLGDQSKMIILGNRLFSATQTIQKVVAKVDEVRNLPNKVFSDIGEKATAPFRNVIDALTQFAGIDNYTNYYVRSTIQGNDDKAPDVAIGASVGYISQGNNAHVTIGKNAIISAEKDVALNSNAKSELVSFVGNASEFMMPSGQSAAKGIGASVAINNIGAESTTFVNEGARILSKQNVNVDAETKLDNTSIAFAAGAAGKFGLTGNVAVAMGDSKTLSFIDDEATVVAGDTDSTLSITAKNDTKLNNAAGGFVKGTGTAVGVGIAVNVNNVDTMSGITDTDWYSESYESDISDVEARDNETEDEKLARKLKNKASRAARLVQETINANSDSSLYGYKSVETAGSTGSISAAHVKSSASSTGLINAVGLTGAKASSPDEKETKPGFFDTVKKTAMDKAQALLGKIDGVLNSDTANKTGFTVKDATNASVPGEEKADSAKSSITETPSGAPTTGPSTQDGAKVSVAGSVAVNIVDGDTVSFINNANIKLKGGTPTNKNSLESVAKDDVFIGAWAGGAALSLNKSNSSSTGIAGAFGVNVLNRGVSSIIDESAIKDAEFVSNKASSEGATYGAGLGVAVASSSGQGSSTAGSAAVSYNAIDNDLLAVINNSTIDRSEDGQDRTLDNLSLTNTTFTNQLQITGGGSISVSKSGGRATSVGGTIVLADIDNTMASAIRGSTVKNANDVTVESMVGVKQIGVAVTGAVAVGSQNSTAIGGAIAYNSLNNDVLSAVDSSTIEMVGDNGLTVQSYDFKEGAVTDPDYKANKHERYLTEHEVNTDQAHYQSSIANSDSNYKADEDDQNYNKALNTAKDKNAKDGGSLIITGALSLSASSGNGAAGGAFAIDNIDNKFVSRISNNSTITSKNVNVMSDVDTRLIGIASGIAGSGKFAAAGSISWANVDNKSEAYIADSDVTATGGAVDVKATNDAVGVNVAGGIAAGTNAAGLAIAFHGLDNETLAHIDKSNVTTKDLDVNALSGAKIITVGAGVVGTSTNAINGVVAVARGENKTEAYITDTAKAHTIDVTTTEINAKDASKIISIAGGVTAGGTNAVGGAIAINDLGGFSGNTKNSSQNLRAYVSGTKMKVGTSLDVTASDEAHLLTVSAGFAGGGTNAVQGAAAASLINKNVEATVSDTEINKDETESKGKVTLSATNTGEIKGNAVVVAAGGTAGVGAGIGVNRIVQGTNTAVTGSNVKVNDLLMSSKSEAKIQAIGFGGAAAGTVGVAGSFGTNIIDNNTTSAIKTSTILAKGSVGVVSQADDRLANYAGALAGGGTGALGLGVSVNTITGDTKSLIEDSDVTALDQTGTQVQTKSGMDNNSIIHENLDKDAFDIESLKDGRQANSQSGLVVDSSATHSISSIMASGGGAGTIAVFGTVNVNNIGGATIADVVKSDINKNGGGKVKVNAADYVNSSGVVASLSIAGNGAVGVLNDTNLYNRTTRAAILGRALDETSGTKTLKGTAIDVTAASKAGFMNFDASVSAAVEGVGFSGVSTVSKINGSTSAKVNYMKGTLKNHLNVDAYHKDAAFVNTVSAGVAGLGAGAGLTVAVLNQNSQVSASVTGSDMQEETDKSNASISVTAQNDSSVNPLLTSAGIAGIGVGVAGTVAVNNYTQDVATTVSGSKLKAGSVNIGAKGKTSSDTVGGQVAGGLGGVGVSVSVNTFNDNVNAVVDDSSVINATNAQNGNLKISSVAERDISQEAYNVSAGAVAVDANILVNTVNRQVTDADAQAKINKAKTVRNGNGVSYMGLTTDEKTALTNQTAIDANYGTDNSERGVITSINGATLNASKMVDINTEEKNKVNIRGGSFAVGVVSVNGAIGVLDVSHNTKTETIGGTITAPTISINSKVGDLDGSGVKMELYQGAGGVVAAGAAVATTKTAGNVQTIANGTTFKAPTAVIINAEDTSTTTAEAKGIAAGVYAGGAIVSTATNSSNARVNISGIKVDGNGSTGNTFSATTNRTNNVIADAKSAGFGLASASAAAATALDSGESTISVNEGAGATTEIKANATTFSAKSAPRLLADAGSIAGGAVGSFGASISTALATGTSDISIGKGSRVNLLGTTGASTVDISATYSNTDKKDADDESANVTARLEGVGVAGTAAINVNTATARNITKTNVELGKVGFGDTNTPDVDIESLNDSAAKAKVWALSAGTYASGSNFGFVTSKGTSNIAVDGISGETLKVRGLSINASASAKNLVNADGSGGALVAISPVAALTSSTMDNNATVTLKGKWDVSGAVDVAARKTFATDIDTNTLTAALIGGSGAWTINATNGASTVNVDGAEITSTGSQTYQAVTGLDITNKLSASGYGAGALAAAGTFSDDDADLTKEGDKYTSAADTGNNVNRAKGIRTASTVNFNNAKLKTTGRYANIVGQTSTSGEVNMYSNIKSAGIVAGTFTTMKSTILYDNNVNATGSNFYTGGLNSDVILSGVDNTKIHLNAIADTQGGVVGASSAKLASAITRNNKVNVDSTTKMYSTNDVSLFAGRGANGLVSSLDYYITAAAYNKTAIPLATAPSIGNMMFQNNQVNMEGTSESIRHANLFAAHGQSLMAKVAKEYTIWNGGETGSGELVSSIAGQKPSDDDHRNNYVNVAGGATMKAGIHNKLGITISGEITTIGDKGYVAFDLDSGSDWFKETDWYKANIVNGKLAVSMESTSADIIKRYNEVRGNLTKYTPGTDNYTYLKAEYDYLLSVLKENGLAVLDKNTGEVIGVSNKAETLVYKLPDLVVSGGNVDITADKVQGSGSLIAQGSPVLSVTSTVQAGMKVGTMSIADAGGFVMMNGAEQTGRFSNFGGTVSQTGQSGVESTVSLINNAPQKTGTVSDIYILGGVINNAGKVKIANKNYNIYLYGADGVSGSSIEISAPKGNVTQSAPKSNFNVGGSIADQYYNESILTHLRQYMGELIGTGDDRTIKWTWDEVRNLVLTDSHFNDADRWYINNVANKNPYTPRADGAVQAGGDVFINAASINVHGLIQSGYTTYNNVLTGQELTNAKNKIAELDRKNGNATLSDSSVAGNSDYLISGGGKYYDESLGQYVYKVGLYYNPSTKRIVTESVKPIGGHVYLTGGIASAGAGRIIVSDGTPTITINTSGVDRDLAVNAITNKNISGLIRITDTFTKTDKGPLVTEYTNGSVKSYYQQDPDRLVNNGNTNTSYNVADNLYVFSTGGITSTTVKFYEYNEKSAFWGAVKFSRSDTQKLIDKTKSNPDDATLNTREVSYNGAALPQADAITKSTDGRLQGKDFTIYSRLTNKSDPEKSDPVPKYIYDHWWQYLTGSPRVNVKWTETTGSSRDIVTAINVSKDIQVKVDHNSNDTIKLVSAKSIIVNGDLKSATSAGKIDFDAWNGSVKTASGSTASAITDNLKVRATAGIDLNHAALNSTDKAVIDIATGKGNIALNSNYGNLAIYQAVTGAGNPITVSTGDVKISAKGNIVQDSTTQYDDYAIKGKRIDLTSETGSVGEANKALSFWVGGEVLSGDARMSSLNVTAAKDVNMIQNVQGDVRLGQVISTGGNVKLEAKGGSFVDALGDANSDSAAADKIVEDWIASGIISENDTDSTSTNAGINAKKDRVDAMKAQLSQLISNSLIEEGKKASDNLSANTEWQNAYANLKQAQADFNATHSSENTSALEAAKIRYDAAIKAVVGETPTAEERAAIAKVSEFKLDNAAKLSGIGVDAEEAKATLTALEQSRNTKLATTDKINSTASTIMNQLDRTENDQTANRNAFIAVQQDKDATAEAKTAAQNTYIAQQRDSLGGIASDTLKNNEKFGEWLISYREINNSKAKYGWSKNQLLFAIQDSILNAKQGTTVQVKVPNVQANSITLKASGGVGVDEAAQIIPIEQLANLTNLKLLATATSGDVTWNKDANGKNVSATIARQKAINIQLNKGTNETPQGTITVSGSQNIYMAAEENTPFNIYNIKTFGNVTLQGSKGVTPMGDGTAADISGKNLLLRGGDGSLGAANRPLLVDMTGTVDVNADASIYLKNVGNNNLVMLAGAAKDDLYLVSNKGITMSHENGKDMGYLNVTNGTITLVAQDGDVGEAADDEKSNGIRIVSANAAVRAYGNNVYLTDQKLSRTDGNGTSQTMNLVNVHAKDGGTVEVANDGRIKVVRPTDEQAKIRLYENDTVNGKLFTEEAANDEYYTTSSATNGLNAITAPSVSLKSARDKISIDGAITTSNTTGTDLSLSAYQSIDDYAYGEIHANSMNLETTRGISLTSGLNVVNKILFGGVGSDETTQTHGNILINVTTEATEVSQKANDEVVGNITIKNLQHLGQLSFLTALRAVAPTPVEPVDPNTPHDDSYGNVVASTDNGDINVREVINAENNVNLTTNKGNVNIGNNINAENGYVNVKTDEGNVAVLGDGGSISAGTYVDIGAQKGSVNIEGDVTANDGFVKIESKVTEQQSQEGTASGIHVTGNIEAKKDQSTNEKAGIVSFISNTGPINIEGDVKGEEGVKANTNTGNIDFNGKVEADNGDITASTPSGNITFGGEVNAKQGKVDAGSEDGTGNINFVDKVSGKTGVKAQTGTGAIVFEDGADVKSEEGKVETETTSGNINFGGLVSGKKGVKATTNTSGDIVFKGETTSDQKVEANTKGSGNVTFEKNVTGGKGVSATTKNGYIEFKDGANVEATTGDVATETENGKITFGGTTNAVLGNVTAKTTDTGNIEFKKEVSGNAGVSAQTKTGDIIFDTGANVGSAAGTVSAKTETGDVGFGGTVTGKTGVTATVDKDGNITFEGTTASDAKVEAKTATKGNINFKEAVSGKTGVSAETKEGNITFDTGANVESSAGSVTAKTTTGNVGFGGTVSGKTGVSSDVGTGNINYSGDVTATGGNVSSKTNTTTEGKGNITYGAGSTVKAEAGDIISNTNLGDVTFGGVAEANKNITTGTKKGDVQYGGNASAGTNISTTVETEGGINFVGTAKTTSGDINSSTQKGDIKFASTAQSGKNIISTTKDEGDIEYAGSVSADTDIISTVETAGDIKFTGEAHADHDIASSTKNGDITFSNNASAGNDINSTTKDNGNINFGGTVHATHDINATTMSEKPGNAAQVPEGNGDITFEGAVSAGNDVNADANGNGSVFVKDDVTANNNISMSVQNSGANGGILFNKEDVDTIDVHAVTGGVNLIIKEGGSGNISDGHATVEITTDPTTGKKNTIVTQNPDGTKANITAGTRTENQYNDPNNNNTNIKIANAGTVGGFVNLSNVYAEDDVRVQSATKDENHGGVVVELLNGERVIVAVGSSRAGAMQITHMSAGQSIAVAGANIDIEHLDQRPERDNMLGAQFKNENDPNAPMENVSLGDVNVNTGFLIDQLWLKNGQLTVNTGRFELDKVYVEEKATFSNGNMVTNIFGIPPVLEAGASSTYWNNTSIFKPNETPETLERWYQEKAQPEKWQFLYFTNGGPVQTSNGNLLSLSEYYYAYNQRYTMDDTMRRMSTDKLQNFYPKYYNTELHYFERFTPPVIEESPVKARNADEDELEVVK